MSDEPEDQSTEAAPAPEDVRKKFQEALARKNAHHGSHGTGGAPGGQSHVGPSAGGKTQRQFRRKSG
ncbi:hypothetical protein EV189_2234 [Motilibacter rhizosphaerae]|uniref:DUF5302 domain-containing protein n=1 Tax=Motilibacter rhizosphaerae TaxID=598652 RepID=A0A4Q7NP73_9ACTN|nr:DUF5302 domain-containing protein [Motilibacter rhizosphaerae]RZS86818.1 hypothetical protein EV189_2234 [Motilibacter rhizosphaerae]